MYFVNKKSRKILIATLSGTRVLQWFIEHSFSHISASSDCERHVQTESRSNGITWTLEKWNRDVRKNAWAIVKVKTKCKQTLVRIQKLSHAYKSQIENERKTGIQMVTHIDLCL